MTLEQIIQEARQLPPEQVIELVDRLSREPGVASELEEHWKAETRRRLVEIENGQVEGIPGEEISARVRRIVGG